MSVGVDLGDLGQFEYAQSAFQSSNPGSSDLGQYPTAFVIWDPGPGFVYKMSAYDSACVSPTRVEWLSTTPDLTQAPPFPCGGPWVDMIILDFFLP
jgi:hypothetical protein